MTRRKFERLMRGLSHKIAEKHGYSVTGEMLKKQRDVAKTALEMDGNYQKAWDGFKLVRDAYGMK